MLFTSTEDLYNEIAEDVKKVHEYFKNRKTCETCKLCYQQDLGYSNYTVTDSNIGCFVHKFEESDSYQHRSIFENVVYDPATDCDSYTKGDMWYLDVDGNEPRPSDGEIQIWIRESKIDNLINENCD